MPQPSSLAEFAAHVGTRFRVATESVGVLELELIDAVVLPSRAVPPGVRVDPFSLGFRGPFAPGLPQRIHTLDHDVLGTLALFLVPIGPEGMRSGRSIRRCSTEVTGEATPARPVARRPFPEAH
jgi:hypothetical protein